MKKIKQILNGLLFCIAEVVIGILLLVDPVSFTSGILVAFGVLLTVLGTVWIFRYLKAPVEEASQGMLLTWGLLIMASGLIAIFCTDWILETLPLLTILYGVVQFISGVRKFQFAADTIRRKEGRWIWAMGSSAVTVVCSILILVNPFSSSKAAWIFIGISMIVEAVFDFLAVAFIRILVDGTSLATSVIPSPPEETISGSENSADVPFEESLQEVES